MGSKSCNQSEIQLENYISQKEIGNEQDQLSVLRKERQKFGEQARANRRTSEQGMTLKLRQCLPEAGKRMISFPLGLE